MQNRQHWIAVVKRAGGISSVEAKRIVMAIENAARNELLAGRRVKIRGVGAIEHGRRKPRVMRNPKTLEIVGTQETIMARFVMSNRLRDELRHG